ncbi:MAG: hypothetical protein MRK01_15405 [Candidatus Scalindua sp.]|nr:hypothetical protein [Candidatus Scalindua sp.]
MKKLISTIALFVYLIIPATFTQSTTDGSEENKDSPQIKEDISYQRVFIIPLSEMIDGGLRSSLERRVALAKESSTDLIILEIDSFGGSLKPAFEISEYISNIDFARTVAFIPTKAISAGALIAISCNEIYMAPQSELGDCEPIIPSSEGGYKTVGEKIQTVLRTKFRKFAEKNGYPVLLAEAMVTKEIEIYFVKTEDRPEGYYISGRTLKELTEEELKKITSKKLIIEEGKLLTMHANEAYEYGFAKQIVEDRENLLSLLRIDEGTITVLKTNWSEEMVRFLERIAPILLGIGFVALWIEFKAPGFGLPGIIGVLCLATVFLSKYLVGLAEAPEIIVFFVGIAFLAAEILIIPGFGIAGIAGIILILIGVTLSFQDFTLPKTPYDTELFTKNIFTVLCSLLGSGIAIFMLVKYMPGIPIFSHLILTAEAATKDGFAIAPQPKSECGLTGKRGITLTTLHPTGKIELEDQTFDVVTCGEFVEKGYTVEIVAVKGNRIVVKSI